MANLAAADEELSPLPFEDALRRLEQIVAELEEGRAGLETSLQHYEEGVGLLRYCHTLLSGAERRIELLSGIDANGQPVTQPFDHTASLQPSGEPDAQTPKRSKRVRPPAAQQPAPDEASPQSDVDTSGKLF